MKTETKTVAHRFYECIHSGDFIGLFEMLSDDCVIEFYGPAVIPFAGYFNGKEKCRIFFGHVANDVDILGFTQDEFIVDELQAAVTGRLKLRFHATGGIYDSEYAHIIDVRDGRIVRFRDFQNSAKAAAVCAPVETPIR